MSHTGGCIKGGLDVGEGNREDLRGANGGSGRLSREKREKKSILNQWKSTFLDRSDYIAAVYYIHINAD